MSFWNLSYSENQLALIDSKSGVNLTYQDLYYLVTKFEEQFNDFQQKTLGVIFCRNHLDSLVAYLAALRTQHTVFLLDADLHPILASQLLDVYQPNWIFSSNDSHLNFSGFQEKNKFLDSTWYLNIKTENINIHSDLAVLLSTSGSTGSPKVVRLSYKNLAANAESIANYLNLSPIQRPITTLPMHYSYGLSVINSHLFANATLLLTQESISTGEFWSFAQKHKVTSIAGVPYIYQVLHRMKFENINLPSLKILTQAGGRLSPHLVEHFASLAKKKEWQFFVMYGQTEATARISYMPSNRIKDKLESIGQAIPGGKLMLDPNTSELIYQGPNVMMGYANTREDLSKGDSLQGILRTGDIAEKDEEGFFKIIGRKKRFLKLFGLRINLEEVELMLERDYQIEAASTGNDDKLQIFIEDADKISSIKADIAERYQLHPTAIEVNHIPKIPRSDRGKPDYTRLQQLIEGLR